MHGVHPRKLSSSMGTRRMRCSACWTITPRWATILALSANVLRGSFLDSGSLTDADSASSTALTCLDEAFCLLRKVGTMTARNLFMTSVNANSPLDASGGDQNAPRVSEFLSVQSLDSRACGRNHWN